MHSENGTVTQINVKGPRLGDSSYRDVLLRFRYLHSETEEAVVFPRIFTSFFDFDESQSGASKCVQVTHNSESGAGASIEDVLRDDTTEIVEVTDPDPDSHELIDPDQPLFCATESGTGALRLVTQVGDDPAAPEPCIAAV